MYQLNFFFKSKIFLIFIISSVIFTAKWYNYLLSENNIETQILFNYIADSKYWLPYIKFISEFSLNKSFEPGIYNLKILPLPIGSLFIYSIFFKFFGLHSIIIIEFIAIFLFLFLFYKIFVRFCSKNIALLISVFIVTLPEILGLVYFDFTLIENIIKNLYSLRIHRPIFSNIFFLISIYLLIKEIKTQKLNIKNIFILAFMMGLLFSSFYYFFIIIFLSTIIVITFKTKFEIFNFSKNYKLMIFSILIFILSSLPFILILFLHENDVSKGAGLILLDKERKIKILEYFFSNYSDFKFLFILFVFSIVTYFFRKTEHGKIINLFYIIFISSLISPILFILLSSKSGLIYHFNNNILLCMFLYGLVLSSLLIDKFFKKKRKLIYLLLTLIIIFNLQSNLNSSKNNQEFLNKNTQVREFNIITKKLIYDFDNSFDEKGILTFDTNFMIWSILNNFKYINVLNHMWTPKKHWMIENDLVRNFNLLNLNFNDFELFLSNKFTGWRYYNENMGEIFSYRYQANSLISDKEDFFDDIKMKNFILNSKPSLNQQIALSKKEKKRLTDLFIKNKELPRIPEFIVINSNKNFLNNYKLDGYLFCKTFNGKRYSLYYQKKFDKC